jgi:hypothetical protein
VFLGVSAFAIVAGILTYEHLAGPETSPRPEQQITRGEPATRVYAQALLDLRGHSPSRSQSPATAPAESELALPRGRLALTIVLPVASEEGAYSIRIGRPGEEAVLEGKGQAEMKDGTTFLELRVDTSDLSAGKYVLGVRQEPWPWAEYALELR